MAERISLRTGAKKYEIENENGTIIGFFEINPTDVNIAKRYKEMQDFFENYDYSKLDSITEEDVSEAISFSDQVTEKLDYLFGYNVSKNLFSFCSPLATVDGDKLYFHFIIEMLEGILENATKEAAAEKVAKVEAATEGY